MLVEFIKWWTNCTCLLLVANNLKSHARINTCLVCYPTRTRIFFIFNSFLFNILIIIAPKNKMILLFWSRQCRWRDQITLPCHMYWRDNICHVRRCFQHEKRCHTTPAGVTAVLSCHREWRDKIKPLKNHDSFVWHWMKMKFIWTLRSTTFLFWVFFI